MAKRKLLPKKAQAKKPAKSKKAVKSRALAQASPSASKKKVEKSSAKKSVKSTRSLPSKSTRPSSSKRKPAQKETSALAVLLQPGDQAPSFLGLNEKGEQISSLSLLGKKVILYFYPKDDTPGCTQESCDFRDSFSRVKSAGAEVFGVSRDSVASHLKFQQKHGFPFSLLSDEDGKICEAYGVWKEKNLYGRKYMGIERTTFLIDESGKILNVYPKVKVNGHVDQILEDLKK